MTELSVLHEQLELHKKSLKNVDESIKRLSGKEGETTNSIKNENQTENAKNGRIIGRIVSSLSSSSVAKRKYQDEQRTNGVKRNLNESLDDDPAIKKRTLQSSVVSSNMPIKSKEDLIKIQNKHNGSEQRNKRIFGVLLGTLKQFKSDDKERSSTSQAIQRKELEKKIEVKKVEELARITEEKKRLVEEKNKQLRNIEILEEKIQLTQDFELWKKNHEHLANFIRTKAKPYVYYLPKVVDPKIVKLLEETDLTIKDEITTKSKEIQSKLERLTSESQSLTKTLDDSENNIENKENTKVDLEKSDVNSSESELDEDKNEINVRIGDDEDEDEVTINGTNNENKNEDVNNAKDDGKEVE